MPPPRIVVEGIKILFLDPSRVSESAWENSRDVLRHLSTARQQAASDAACLSCICDLSITLFSPVSEPDGPDRLNHYYSQHRNRLLSVSTAASLAANNTGRLAKGHLSRLFRVSRLITMHYNVSASETDFFQPLSTP